MPLQINGATSGSATLQTTDATTTTLTLPATTGTLAFNGPAFSAYQSSAQTPSAAAFTKVQLQTKEFDTNSNFDNTTNYRFTPTIAGYYSVTANVVSSAANLIVASIYKNGSAFKQGAQGASGNTGVSVDGLIYLNGSTDYIELYIYAQTAAALTATASATYFQASMVRSA